MFYLEYGWDLVCPHCGAEYSVVWTTEYGDPIPGNRDAFCHNCNKDFQFDCNVSTTYVASLK